MITRAVLVTTIAGLLTLGAGIARPGVGAEGRKPQNPAPQGTTPQPQPGMADMMKMHEQMMAEMKANAGRLDALVKAMNAASGTAKTDAIAAVVNELVRQHAGMQTHMRGMHETMMSQHQTPAKP